MADPTNTVTSQFLTEITVIDAPVQTLVPGTEQAGEGPAGSVVGSLAELNALFTSWVQMVYHRTVHSSTAMSPLARWGAGWAGRSPDRRHPDVIIEAFRWSALRKVTRTGTVSLQGNTYQVDPSLAGTRVELTYDPFDLTGPIAVTAAGGIPAGDVLLQDIRRHVHPKAVAATKDADTAAANAASGIDYLRLVEDRHKAEVTGAPIDFEKLGAAGTGPATGTDGATR